MPTYKSQKLISAFQFLGNNVLGKCWKEEEVVEKEGVEVAYSGIEGERVQVAPTKPTTAATVEVMVAVADEVAVEKARDAPEAPSSIEEERRVEVTVVEEVTLAPAEMAAVLTQEMELTQEQIVHECIQQWLVVEHARQQKEAASPPNSLQGD